ncbi:hypothetical protein [uncultured Microbacterium sp.]|uniref:hypothetical protein n=1 Tax=uncultured Microbacterium sp. TaxID=191216 RepID=UPI0028E93A19|nr:hypothetical protein [uncultured Microbacterium sp.]
MTTLRMASDLAAVMVPIGYVGAALAVIFAIVAAVAIVRGSGGLAGGAVGLWIVGALMSFAASFAREWTPLIVACAALTAMLIVGSVVRAIVNADGVERADRAVEELPKAVPASKTPVTATSKTPVAATSKVALTKTGPATATIAVVR